MKVAVLTSSRADFGIYLPLLKRLKTDSAFDLKIIAFGTHLSAFHGYTKDNILQNGFDVDYEIESMLLSDTKESVSSAMGLTMIKFASFWKEHENDFDIVLSLGDRYEMFAAVYAALPFNINFAHLHGGEKTLGAIDNMFRHALSHAAKIHFTSCEAYKARVEELLDEPENVYNVGALSLDNIQEIPFLTIEEFKEKWGIDLSKPTALVTFHPETVAADANKEYASDLVASIKKRPDIQFLITMPNADTAGNIVRKIFVDELSDLQHVHMEENLGTQSYFTAMKYSKFLLGNTSSGIIEAASFEKYVINLGDRQKGRLCGENVIQTPIVEKEIDQAIEQCSKMASFEGENVYFNGGAANEIVKVLKQNVK